MELQKIPGIGPATEQKLVAAGIVSAEALANHDASTGVEGFTGKQLEGLIAKARTAVGSKPARKAASAASKPKAAAPASKNGKNGDSEVRVTLTEKSSPIEAPKPVAKPVDKPTKASREVSEPPLAVAVAGGGASSSTSTSAESKERKEVAKETERGFLARLLGRFFK